MTPLFEEEGTFTMKSVRGRWQLDGSNGGLEGVVCPHIRSGEGYAEELYASQDAQTSPSLLHCNWFNPRQECCHVSNNVRRVMPSLYASG